MDFSCYIKKFNDNDEELVKTYIGNNLCESYLEENAPKLICPDKTIEETFAFRCWTIRKHIKKTDYASNKNIYNVIKKYADMHYLDKGDKRVNWIDEVMSPNEYIWTSREILKKNGFTKESGGVERGKDYNHSSFCDLVIRGLIGVKINDGLTVKNNVKGIWKYFKLENLRYKNNVYDIIYDEDGSRFGEKGLKILKNNLFN